MQFRFTCYGASLSVAKMTAQGIISLGSWADDKRPIGIFLQRIVSPLSLGKDVRFFASAATFCVHYDVKAADMQPHLALDSVVLSKQFQ